MIGDCRFYCIPIFDLQSPFFNRKTSAMKCKFLIPTQPVNPAYSQAAANAAAEAGVPYDVPQRLSFGPGLIVDDPQAWIHCCPGDMNKPPIAEPADDACRAKVAEWMTVNRPAGIAQIKAQLEQIDLLTNDDDKGRLLALGRAYGLIGNKGELQGVSPPSTPAFDPETN
jgi:hypothetical protein